MEDELSLKNVFKQMWSKVVVRTVENAELKSGRPTLHYIDPLTGIYQSFESDDRDIRLPRQCTYLQLYNPILNGDTSRSSINPKAENPKFIDRRIEIVGDKYCEPYFEEHGWFSNDSPNRAANDCIRIGDVIMGLIDLPLHVLKSDRVRPKFTHWFIPSPQFYRIWRWIVLEDESALDEINYEEELCTIRFNEWNKSPPLKLMNYAERVAFMKYGCYRHDSVSYKYSYFWVDFYEMIVNNCPNANSPMMTKLFNNMIDNFNNDRDYLKLTRKKTLERSYEKKRLRNSSPSSSVSE